MKKLIVIIVIGMLASFNMRAEKPTCLMFGQKTRNKNTRTFLDFSYVTPEDAFTDKTPWGFRDKPRKLRGKPSVQAWTYGDYSIRARGKKGSLPTDTLLEHGMCCRKGTFSVRTSNGPTIVRMWLGDWVLNLRRLWPNNHIVIKAEDKVVYDETVTPEKAYTEQWWLKEKSKLYSKTISPWERLVAPILTEIDFVADVKDGVLDLEMENAIVTALVVAPESEKQRLNKILDEIKQERQAQFAKRYPWKPQPDEPMPEVSSEAQKRGFVLFQAYGGDTIHPWTRPDQERVTDTVRIFAARDEQEPARFGVLPIRDLKAFSVNVGDFSTSDGAIISTTSHADLWRERYIEQGSKSTTGIIKDIRDLDPFSDVMLEPTPIDCETGVPRVFTLDVRVPVDAKPGTYTAPMTFHSAGKEIGKASIILLVLPFQMDYAPVPFSFQVTGFTGMWPDRLEGYDPATLRETIVKRVGFIGKYRFNFTDFTAPWGYGVNSDMRWGAIKGEPGDRHFTQTPEEEAEMNWWFKLIREKGNVKDWVQLEYRHLFLNAGWTPGRGATGKSYGKPTDSPEDLREKRKDIVNILRDVNTIAQEKGYPKIYWSTAGEPDNEGLKGVEASVEMTNIEHEAGCASLRKINGSIAAKLIPPVSDIVLSNFATPITDELIAYVKKCGHKFGGHNTGDSRLAAGWQFWRIDGCTKFQEAIFYTGFMLPYAYLPWNYNTAFVYPAKDIGWRPSARFLSYRDGRDDFMYLKQLEGLIEKAKKAGLGDTPAAKQAQAFLEESHKKIHIDARKYFSKQVNAIEASSVGQVGWTPKKFQRYRWFVANLIMDLKKTLKNA